MHENPDQQLKERKKKTEKEKKMNQSYEKFPQTFALPQILFLFIYSTFFY